MKERQIELYKKMYLIRASELMIQEYYLENKMKTPMHMSMGEEAIVVGVVHALKPEDQVLGTYRSHALYLSKAGETDQFFAEMYGKSTGMAHGKSGSMHLSAIEKGMLCSSAIVASSIPVAMGVSYANKYLKNNKIVAVFFGDGATDEGVFWETINYACLRKLPLLLVCEDNGLAVHTAREQRHGFPSINEVVKKFDCNVYEESSTDPEVIYSTTSKALEMMEKNGKPCFLRFHYYRYLEHVGINEDFMEGYRSKEIYKKWLKVDPLCIQKEKLITLGLTLKYIQEIEHSIDEKIAKSIDFAEKSPYSDLSEIHNGVFICA